MSSRLGGWILILVSKREPVRWFCRLQSLTTTVDRRKFLSLKAQSTGMREIYQVDICACVACLDLQAGHIYTILTNSSATGSLLQRLLPAPPANHS